MADHPICSALTKDGEPCKGFCRPGKPFCTFHDPEAAEQCQEARRAGGRASTPRRKTAPTDSEDLPLETVKDVASALAVVFNATWNGMLDVRVANSLTATASALVRTLEGADLQALLEEQGRELEEFRRDLEVLRRERSNHAQTGGAQPDGAGGAAAGVLGNPVLESVRGDPAAIFRAAGMTADPWQERLLRSSSNRILMLASRQTGKNTTSAALALKAALLNDGSTVLLLSPTLRQSAELFLKTLGMYRDLGRPVASLRPRDNVLRLDLVNGSRIISLPGNESTIRGFSSVRLLVVDEAARVPDALYFAVRPMLAVSGGSLVCVSSAYAKLGFFSTEWSGENRWERACVKATECPRIDPKFLEEERQALGDRWFNMEYQCQFGDAVDAVFREEDIQAALCDEPIYLRSVPHVR